MPTIKRLLSHPSRLRICFIHVRILLFVGSPKKKSQIKGLISANVCTRMGNGYFNIVTLNSMLVRIWWLMGCGLVLLNRRHERWQTSESRESRRDGIELLSDCRIGQSHRMIILIILIQIYLNSLVVSSHHFSNASAEPFPPSSLIFIARTKSSLGEGCFRPQGII